LPWTTFSNAEIAQNDKSMLKQEKIHEEQARLPWLWPKPMLSQMGLANENDSQPTLTVKTNLNRTNQLRSHNACATAGLRTKKKMFITNLAQEKN